jgi:hypothetical protein
MQQRNGSTYENAIVFSAQKMQHEQIMLRVWRPHFSLVKPYFVALLHLFRQTRDSEKLLHSGGSHPAHIRPCRDPGSKRCVRVFGGKGARMNAHALHTTLCLDVIAGGGGLRWRALSHSVAMHSLPNDLFSQNGDGVF